jgi:hypothetical protein
MDSEDITGQGPFCYLCRSPLAHAPAVHRDYVACRECGLVQAPGRLFKEPSLVADGWRDRAYQLGPDIPKSASRCPSVSSLAAALQLGPVYVETPNAAEPRLSLRAFFAERHPVYYSPETLAICVAMAGAADVMMNDVGGCVAALVIPGAERRSFEQARDELGIPLPDGESVAARLRSYFAPRPPEVLGEPLPGACFLCGGARHAWRSVALCAGCSTLTTTTQPDVLEGLSVSTTPLEFVTPNMRTTTPDECERFALSHGAFLDEAAWGMALVRAGADLVRCQKHDGALMLGAVSAGEPRRKSFLEARDIHNKPLRLGRHTVAIWNTGPPREAPFEAWLSGEDMDQGMLREEVRKALATAAASLSALDTIARCCEAAQSDDDWHSNPYLCGFRMGEAKALIAAQSMAMAAYAEIAGRVAR